MDTVLAGYEFASTGSAAVRSRGIADLAAPQFFTWGAWIRAALTTLSLPNQTLQPVQVLQPCVRLQFGAPSVAPGSSRCFDACCLLIFVVGTFPCGLNIHQELLHLVNQRIVAISFHSCGRHNLMVNPLRLVTPAARNRIRQWPMLMIEGQRCRIPTYRDIHARPCQLPSSANSAEEVAGGDGSGGSQ
jgi:hypothetical protein